MVGSARRRVVVETASGAHTVRAEVARSEEDRARGLMNRTELAADAGMLFVFDESADHPFWMKDTLLPLDLVFVDERWRVAGVVERAEPLSLRSRTIGTASRYVLEVNGGWAAAHGVRPGDRVRLEGAPTE